jgi:hypothetical protein
MSARSGRRTQPEFRSPGSRLEWPRQLALFLGASLVYFGVRFLTEGSFRAAVANAHDILHLERLLGIDVEGDIQSFVLRHHWLTTFANWVYIWIHWPLIAFTFIMLFRRRRGEYVLLRNAMFVSGAVGIFVFALFPVAPPRLLPTSAYVDTITNLSHSYRVLQPPSLANEYAAMPSFHAGWNLLVGIALFRNTGSRLVRALVLTSPVLMTFAVVATANHYLLDPIMGFAVSLGGFGVAWWWASRRQLAAASNPPATPALP